MTYEKALQESQRDQLVESYGFRVRYTTAPRPDVPEEWVILNAPRPLHGDEEWRGDFLCGVFYVAVDPNGERAAWMLSEDAKLDAALLAYVTEDEVYDGQIEHLRESGFTEQEVAEFKAVYTRQYVISCGLDALNGLYD